MNLEPEARVDCVKRLATMKQFSPEAAAKASRVLNRRFASGLAIQSRRSDSGFKNLADLMNRMDPTAARQILETIEAKSRSWRSISRHDVHVRKLSRSS